MSCRREKWRPDAEGKDGSMANEQYTQIIAAAEGKLLRFLQTFESVQENMHIGLEASQAQLREVVGDIFPALQAELSQASPPESLSQFHGAFGAAIRHFDNASAAFLNPGDRDFSLASLDSRRALYRGIDILYKYRAHLPGLRSYWLLPEALPNLDALETASPDAKVPVGMTHNKETDARGAYSLYVPENYSPQKNWPLIICLHGAYGRGDHYVWSWLRPAKSKGYMLLSPKSVDGTWSILRPPIDVRSITTMFEEVCQAYAVDRSRVYLTGLSDGGTYTYLFGLYRAEMFAGIAPIAGDFHYMIDDLLHQKQGIELPIYIVHGAHDHIFPVETIRDGHKLLTRIGYNSTYEELPDWGHAHTSSINEKLVFPWIESLAPNSESVG
jgi:phospholipase/carboxylesterase